LSDIKGLPIGAEGVVLSACNTAAAEKNGMEAISGLGHLLLSSEMVVIQCNILNCRNVKLGKFDFIQFGVTQYD
jgi:hypothetical protein